MDLLTNDDESCNNDKINDNHNHDEYNELSINHNEPKDVEVTEYLLCVI